MTARPADVRLVLKQVDEWAALGARLLAENPPAVALAELHVELTHRCDLKCVMCHHWEMPDKVPGSVARELTVDDFRRLVAASRLQNVATVAVTGGEPLVRPEAVEIVALLRRAFPNASLGVLANLWNAGSLRRRLGELRERGVEGLWLGSSLDGLGAMHDSVRGQAGAFAGFEKSLAMLKSEFPETKVSVNFTILPENRGQLWDVYRYARDRDLGFGAQYVVNHEGFEAPQTFAWKDEELSEVEEQIDRVIADLCRRHSALERLVAHPPAESRWLWVQLLFWSRLREHGRGQPRFFDDCMAGRRWAMLSAEGDLFFCPVNKHKTVGNVREAGFDAVWDGKAAEKRRAETTPCECRCWLNCIANPLADRVLGAALAAPAGTAA
jgi:MoaA/NifB/PqqE/SkfB family radical SAM enzyme